MSGPENSNQNEVFNRFSLRGKFGVILRGALIIVVYLLTFLIMALVSRDLQALLGIAAWNPPDGFGFALLLGLGPQFFPALAIALFISRFFVFQCSMQSLELSGWDSRLRTQAITSVAKP